MHTNNMLRNKYLVFVTLILLESGGCQVYEMCEPDHFDVDMFDMTTSALPYYSFVQPESTEEDIPIILWWTDRLFPEKDLMQVVCPSSVCYTTSDRKYVEDSRTTGFYFYGTDLTPDDMPLPRKPHHEWALYHEESPMNNYMLTHNTMLKLFNHTATFRRESDYPITSHSIPNLKYILERKHMSLIADKNRARSEGLAPVLYAQSHCDVSSDRDRYVLELMKHIKVDSVGGCLHNKDIAEDIQDPVQSMDSPKFLDLISKYKFHLAFENAICKDYMTEKLFRPLHVGSVPVCRGSTLVKDWMPNNSVIIANDFTNPKKLAEFLNYLDEHDEAYLKYLEYKEYGINNTLLFQELQDRKWEGNHPSKPDSLMGFQCYVCQKLTERHEVEKLHLSDPSVPLLPPHTAHTDHLNCPQPYPSIGSIEDLPSDDSWKQYFWVEDYWGSLDRARALTKMIEQKEEDPKSFSKYWENMYDLF